MFSKDALASTHEVGDIGADGLADVDELNEVDTARPILALADPGLMFPQSASQLRLGDVRIGPNLPE